MKKRKIDERDIMFSRMNLTKGTPQYDYYYKKHPDLKELDDNIRSKPDLGTHGTAMFDPILSKIADANFAYLADMRKYVEGNPNPDRTEVQPEEITKLLKSMASHYGAVEVGVTRVDPLSVYSHRGRHMENYGDKVDIKHEYAFVFAVKMDREVINRAPKVSVTMETSRAYVEAATIGMKLSYFIRELGYDVRNHMDGNYLLQCVPMAIDAGLGQAGRNGLLTTMEYGSRVRLGVVTTDLPLICDAPIDFGMEELCKACKRCVRTCPGKAISISDDTQEWYCRQEKCYDRWRSLGTDCGICIAACPVSQDSPLDVFGSDFEKYDEKTIAETLDRFEQKYGIRPFDKRPWPLEEV